MASWPDWLILVSLVVIAILWIAYSLTVYADAGELWSRQRNLLRREREMRHAKK